MDEKIHITCDDCGREWEGLPGSECHECGGTGQADDDWEPDADCPCGCEGDVECHVETSRTGQAHRRAGF
jgi:hypothetical protein